MNRTNMLVRFIAHAGVYLEEDGHSLVIDPWFLDSTPEHPVIESIGGGFRTIDFQIPKTTENIASYAPDAILISHFHPHHSPLRDIQILVKNSGDNKKNVTVLYPRPSDAMEAHVTDALPSTVVHRECIVGDQITIGPFTIETRGHTVPFHNSWYVRSSTGSVLHMTDARMNRDRLLRAPDKIWSDLANLAPSILFISAGGHSVRFSDKEGSKTIWESEALSAVDAAKITTLIKPKAVGIIGVYNHSVWKNRTEYILPTAITLEQFEWALSWLCPAIEHRHLFPGYSFRTGKMEEFS
jgi:hypothetical protein